MTACWRRTVHRGLLGLSVLIGVGGGVSLALALRDRSSQHTSGADAWALWTFVSEVAFGFGTINALGHGLALVRPSVGGAILLTTTLGLMAPPCSTSTCLRRSRSG